MKIFNNCLLLFLLMIIFFVTSCSIDQREVILERYSSGSKYIVGIYKGSGTNEILLERRYYQENGTLGRIEDLQADSTINYKEIHPEVLTSEGLKDFLNGYWSSVRKIDHNRYDVYETATINFVDSTAERRYDLVLCNRDNDVGFANPVIDASFESKIDYKENLELKEKINFFYSRMYESEWLRFLNRYDLQKPEFSMSIYHTIGEYMESLNEAYSLLKNENPGVDKFTTLVGYASIDGIKINNFSNGDSIIIDYSSDIRGQYDNRSSLNVDDGLKHHHFTYRRGGISNNCKNIEERVIREE